MTLLGWPLSRALSHLRQAGFARVRVTDITPLRGQTGAALRVVAHRQGPVPELVVCRVPGPAQ